MDAEGKTKNKVYVYVESGAAAAAVGAPGETPDKGAGHCHNHLWLMHPLSSSLLSSSALKLILPFSIVVSCPRRPRETGSLLRLVDGFRVMTFATRQCRPSTVFAHRG